MSEPRFYALPEERALAFGRRVDDLLAKQDLGSWRRLYAVLSALRRRPYLSHDGELSLDQEPLARFDWHLPPDQAHEPLSAETVPRRGTQGLQWLLMNAILQACDYRLFIRWPKFSFGWTITIPDERIVRPGGERVEFDLLVRRFFDHPGGLPGELAFLEQASHLHAYVSARDVHELLQAEKDAGLLLRLAEEYNSSEEQVTRSFGTAIAELAHFLSTAGLEGQAVFMCYYTP